MAPKPQSVNRLCLRSVDFTPTGDSERSEAESDGRTLEGYAAVFDTPTEINSWEGKFSETIAKGAFRKTIKERKPVLQFDHGHDARTGSVPIGKFEDISEDDDGLFVSARLFDNPVVEPIRQAIEGGAISGMSFRFKVVRDEWRDNQDKVVRGDELLDLLWERDTDRGPLKRSIKEVELFEAGPVVFPAYPETTVGVRSLSDDDRDALVEQYRRSIEDSSAEESTTDEVEEDAAREGTSESTETPETPSVEDTSSGHEKEATPKREKKVPATVTRKESVPMNEPMTIEERTARQSEIRSRLAEIDTEFSGATLPDETQREWDEISSEHEEHERAIEAAQDRAERLKALAGDTRNTERGSDRGQRPVRRRPDNIYDLSEIRQQARSQDDLAGLYRDNAMRAVEQARFPGVEDREGAQENVARLLDYVDDDSGNLARRLLATGSPQYDRAFGKVLKTLNTGSLTAEEQRALSLGVDASGGYAVPFQLDPTVILSSDGSINPLRQHARVEQITGKEWQGITSEGITVSRVAENIEAEDNAPTLVQPTVKAERVQGFVPFSMELDQDWGRMRDELTRLLADAKEQEEATAFFLGTGVAPDANGIVSTLAAGSLVTTDTPTAFGALDVYALEEALAPRFRGRARFMANKAVFNAIRQFAASDGHELWERIGAGQPAELLGYPAHEASSMSSTLSLPATPAASSKILLFGDFSQFLIVDRVGMNVELVPHLFGSARRYPTGQRGVYAVWRNNSKILVDNAFRLLQIVEDGVA